MWYAAQFEATVEKCFITFTLLGIFKSYAEGHVYCVPERRLFITQHACILCDILWWLLCSGRHKRKCLYVILSETAPLWGELCIMYCLILTEGMGESSTWVAACRETHCTFITMVLLVLPSTFMFYCKHMHQTNLF